MMPGDDYTSLRTWQEQPLIALMLWAYYREDRLSNEAFYKGMDDPKLGAFLVWHEMQHDLHNPRPPHDDSHWQEAADHIVEAYRNQSKVHPSVPDHIKNRLPGKIDFKAKDWRKYLKQQR